MKLSVLFLGKKGGGCSYTYEMSKMLLEQDIKIQLILSSYIENKALFIDLKEQYSNLELVFLKTYNSKVSFLLSSMFFLKFIKTAEKIDSYSPDWIYIPMLSLYTSFVLFFLRKKTKIVTTIHDFNQHKGEENKISEILFNYSIKKSTRLIILSKTFLIPVTQRYGFTQSDVLVLSHPNYNYYRPQCFKEKSEITKIILFFGRIHEYKGIDILLEAMKLLKSSDFKLKIVGSGNFSDLQKKKIAELKNKIFIVNRWIRDEEIFSFFEDVDLVVAPYIEASQSGVVMTAYAFSKPVIVTNTGGLPEQVTEGTGLVVEAGDPLALANAIKKLYTNPDHIIAMGKKGYLIATNELSWESAVKKLVKFLAE